MSDRLSLSQVAALMAYAATTAGGQLLFKTPALRGAVDGPLAPARSGNIRIDSKPLAYCHPSVPGDRCLTGSQRGWVNAYETSDSTKNLSLRRPTGLLLS